MYKFKHFWWQPFVILSIQAFPRVMWGPRQNYAPIGLAVLTFFWIQERLTRLTSLACTNIDNNEAERKKMKKKFRGTKGFDRVNKGFRHNFKRLSIHKTRIFRALFPVNDLSFYMLLWKPDILNDFQTRVDFSCWIGVFS